jgi:hypothetical protein
LLCFAGTLPRANRRPPPKPDGNQAKSENVVRGPAFRA